MYKDKVESGMIIINGQFDFSKKYVLENSQSFTVCKNTILFFYKEKKHNIPHSEHYH